MSDPPTPPPRPPTPQVMLHRLPDKAPDDLSDSMRKPSKYIILIMGSTAVAGKLQIARSVASRLGCPLYQGDSIHDSSAKAASVGVSSGHNEARYQRMWLSKLTRTGLLFPEESKPATMGFSGFGGTSSTSLTSTSTSRRGSTSSVASASSDHGSSPSVAGSNNQEDPLISSTNIPRHLSPPGTSIFTSNPVPWDPSAAFTLSQEERNRRGNPVLMVLLHTELDPWHKLAIRKAVGDYGVGVIFTPLYNEGEGEEKDHHDDQPILQQPDSTPRLGFPVSMGLFYRRPRGWGNLNEEMKLSLDVNADIDRKTNEIIVGVKDIIGDGV